MRLSGLMPKFAVLLAPVILIERIKQNIKVYIMKNSGAVYLQIDVRSMLKEQRQGIGSDIFVTNIPHHIQNATILNNSVRVHSMF